MFLTDGRLVQLNDDGTEGAQYIAHQNQKTLSIGAHHQADVVLNTTVASATSFTSASAIYCEIIGDAFGRITIANRGATQLLVNGMHIRKQRPLVNGSQIEIGAHKLCWHCPTVARPVTPDDLLSKSMDTAKLNAKTAASYSAPASDVRAKKQTGKVRKMANKMTNPRFTIYTCCPQTNKQSESRMMVNSSATVVSSVSDENSINKANSVAGDIDADIEADDIIEKSESLDSDTADELAPDERLELDDSFDEEMSAVMVSDSPVNDDLLPEAQPTKEPIMSSDDLTYKMDAENVANIEPSDLNTSEVKETASADVSQIAEMMNPSVDFDCGDVITNEQMQPNNDESGVNSSKTDQVSAQGTMSDHDETAEANGNTSQSVMMANDSIVKAKMDEQNTAQKNAELMLHLDSSNQIDRSKTTENQSENSENVSLPVAVNVQDTESSPNDSIDSIDEAPILNADTNEIVVKSDTRSPKVSIIPNYAEETEDEHEDCDAATTNTTLVVAEVHAADDLLQMDDVEINSSLGVEKNGSSDDSVRVIECPRVICEDVSTESKIESAIVFAIHKPVSDDANHENKFCDAPAEETITIESAILDGIRKTVSNEETCDESEEVTTRSGDTVLEDECQSVNCEDVVPTETSIESAIVIDTMESVSGDAKHENEIPDQDGKDTIACFSEAVLEDNDACDVPAKETIARSDDLVLEDCEECQIVDCKVVVSSETTEETVTDTVEQVSEDANHANEISDLPAKETIGCSDDDECKSNNCEGEFADKSAIAVGASEQIVSDAKHVNNIICGVPVKETSASLGNTILEDDKECCDDIASTEQTIVNDISESVSAENEPTEMTSTCPNDAVLEDDVRKKISSKDVSSTKTVSRSESVSVDAIDENEIRCAPAEDNTVRTDDLVCNVDKYQSLDCDNVFAAETETVIDKSASRLTVAQPSSVSETLAARQTPIITRRRSTRKSVDRSICDHCDDVFENENLRPLSMITELRSAAITDAVVGTVPKTPARRRSTRNSTDRLQPSLIETPNTPRTKRVFLTSGVSSSPLLLTPRRRSARKSCESSITAPLQIDPELKHKLEVIDDSPEPITKRTRLSELKETQIRKSASVQCLVVQTPTQSGDRMAVCEIQMLKQQPQQKSLQIASNHNEIDAFAVTASTNVASSATIPKPTTDMLATVSNVSNKQTKFASNVLAAETPDKANNLDNDDLDLVSDSQDAQAASEALSGSETIVITAADLEIDLDSNFSEAQDQSSSQPAQAAGSEAMDEDAVDEVCHNSVVLAMVPPSPDASKEKSEMLNAEHTSVSILAENSVVDVVDCKPIESDQQAVAVAVADKQQSPIHDPSTTSPLREVDNVMDVCATDSPQQSHVDAATTTVQVRIAAAPIEIAENKSVAITTASVSNFQSTGMDEIVTDKVAASSRTTHDFLNAGEIDEHITSSSQVGTDVAAGEMDEDKSVTIATASVSNVQSTDIDEIVTDEVVAPSRTTHEISNAAEIEENKSVAITTASASNILSTDMDEIVTNEVALSRTMHEISHAAEIEENTSVAITTALVSNIQSTDMDEIATDEVAFSQTMHENSNAGEIDDGQMTSSAQAGIVAAAVEMDENKSVTITTSSNVQSTDMDEIVTDEVAAPSRTTHEISNAAEIEKNKSVAITTASVSNIQSTDMDEIVTDEVALSRKMHEISNAGEIDDAQMASSAQAGIVASAVEMDENKSVTITTASVSNVQPTDEIVTDEVAEPCRTMQEISNADDIDDEHMVNTCKNAAASSSDAFEPAAEATETVDDSSALGAKHELEAAATSSSQDIKSLVTINTPIVSTDDTVFSEERKSGKTVLIDKCTESCGSDNADESIVENTSAMVDCNLSTALNTDNDSPTDDLSGSALFSVATENNENDDEERIVIAMDGETDGKSDIAQTTSEEEKPATVNVNTSPSEDLKCNSATAFLMRSNDEKNEIKGDNKSTIKLVSMEEVSPPNDGLASSANKKYADDIRPQHEIEATGIVVKYEPSSFNDSNVPDDDMFAEETVSPSSPATKPSQMKRESTSVVATADVVNLNVSPSSHVKISTESECTELSTSSQSPQTPKNSSPKKFKRKSTTPHATVVDMPTKMSPAITSAHIVVVDDASTSETIATVVVDSVETKPTRCRTRKASVLVENMPATTSDETTAIFDATKPKNTRLRTRKASTLIDSIPTPVINTEPAVASKPIRGRARKPSVLIDSIAATNVTEITLKPTRGRPRKESISMDTDVLQNLAVVNVVEETTALSPPSKKRAVRARNQSALVPSSPVIESVKNVITDLTPKPTRGRPRKQSVLMEPEISETLGLDTATTTVVVVDEQATTLKPTRGRGRKPSVHIDDEKTTTSPPSKGRAIRTRRPSTLSSASPTTQTVETTVVLDVAPKPTRGRPRKQSVFIDTEIPESSNAEAPVKVGVDEKAIIQKSTRGRGRNPSVHIDEDKTTVSPATTKGRAVRARRPSTVLSSSPVTEATVADVAPKTTRSRHRKPSVDTNIADDLPANSTSDVVDDKATVQKPSRVRTRKPPVHVDEEKPNQSPPAKGRSVRGSGRAELFVPAVLPEIATEKNVSEQTTSTRKRRSTSDVDNTLSPASSPKTLKIIPSTATEEPKKTQKKQRAKRVVPTTDLIPEAADEDAIEDTHEDYKEVAASQPNKQAAVRTAGRRGAVVVVENTNALDDQPTEKGVPTATRAKRGRKQAEAVDKGTAAEAAGTDGASKSSRAKRAKTTTTSIDEEHDDQPTANSTENSEPQDIRPKRATRSSKRT